MKNAFTKFNIFSYLLIVILIVNVSISTISNYSVKTFLIKIIASSFLVSTVFIHSKVNNIFNIHNIHFKKMMFSLYLVFSVVLLYLSATLLYSLNPKYGAEKIFNLFVGVLPSIAAAFYLYRNATKEVIKIIIVISSVFIFLLLISVLILKPFDQSTIYSFSPERWSHVLVGRLSSILTLIILFAVLSQKVFKKIILLSIIFCAGVYLTYLTGLRSAFIGMIICSLISITIYFVIYKKHKHATDISRDNFKMQSSVDSTVNETNSKNIFPVLVLTAALIISLLLTLIIPSGFQSKQRFENLADIKNLNFNDDSAIQTRLSAYRLSLEIIDHYPILGTGFGGFNGYYFIEWTKEIKYPHNIVLEIASELGLVGLLFFGFLFFMIIVSIYNMPLLFEDLTESKKQKEFIKMQQINFQRLIIYILFFFSLWLAMFSKDLSSQGLLWLFIILLRQPK